MSEWISVNDQMPAVGDNVLSASIRLDGCWEITRTKLCYNSHIKKYHWDYFSSGCGCCDTDQEDVMFWMPLPSPPDIS